MLCGLKLAASSAENERSFSMIVDEINSNPASTWRAVMPNDRDMLRALDLIGGFKELSADYVLPRTKTADEYDSEAPDDFDARTAWPQCPSIRGIRDQCACGACFAFGALEAFEDRICIHLGRNVTLSAEDIISCHTDENMSCQGGNPIAVWEGIFAGKSEGDGAIQESCYPYELPTCPCNHHSITSSLPSCPEEGTLSTPTCDFMKKFSCEDEGIFRAESAHLIPTANMEQELSQNGPITVAFTVYDDFLTYSSGVYAHGPNAKALGGHSVKIIGYGVENSVKYWTVANSWNAEWGDGGFFKIRRGSNEGNIEASAVVAGMPSQPSSSQAELV